MNNKVIGYNRTSKKINVDNGIVWAILKQFFVYHRKIKKRAHFTSITERENYLKTECMRMANLTKIHYKQIQYEFCSKRKNIFSSPGSKYDRQAL